MGKESRSISRICRNQKIDEAYHKNSWSTIDTMHTVVPTWMGTRTYETGLRTYIGTLLCALTFAKPNTQYEYIPVSRRSMMMHPKTYNNDPIRMGRSAQASSAIIMMNSSNTTHSISTTTDRGGRVDDNTVDLMVAGFGYAKGTGGSAESLILLNGPRPYVGSRRSSSTKQHEWALDWCQPQHTTNNEDLGLVAAFCDPVWILPVAINQLAKHGEETGTIWYFYSRVSLTSLCSGKRQLFFKLFSTKLTSHLGLTVSK